MKHIWLLLSLALFTSFGQAQVIRLAELNSRQITELDRQKTVVIMPGGTMEEHGPYLPTFTDGFMNEWWADRLAEAVAKRPGWSAVIYPTIPLGDGGANEIGFKYSFAGTYGVRVKTLRAVYMDLGTELGNQGFRWIFVIQNHGSSLHNLALDQAGDFFHDTYGGQMINLFGLEPTGSEDEAPPAAEFVKESGIDIHAGLSETSRILFIRPNLVDVAYSTAKPFTISDPDDFSKVASRSDWLGYFGTPRRATADYGRYVMEYRSTIMNKAALNIVDGSDPKKIKRFADHAMKEEADIVAGGLKYDDAVEKKQRDWIRKKGLSW